MPDREPGTRHHVPSLDAPLVYLGPSLRRVEAGDLLDGCIVRPPIRRGDLYRDRTIGGKVFLIVDGVFFQNMAVSPREVIDVVKDGALVLGAASMGALRAAECWPCGMRGVGSIYRLFRRGALGSDDEVAVAYADETAKAEPTVALVNVRYAMWKAVRARRLDPPSARRVVDQATRYHFSERRWPVLLTGAGVDRGLLEFVERHDLKALDALRALSRLRTRYFAVTAGARFARRTHVPFAPSEFRREAAYDPNLGRSDAALRRDVSEWLLLSGRYRRYSSQRLPSLSDRSAARRLWHELESRGARDSEVFRYVAFSVAAERARGRGSAAPAWAQRAAEHQLAIEHGFGDYQQLSASLSRRQRVLQGVERYRRMLALALWAARGG